MSDKKPQRKFGWPPVEPDVCSTFYDGLQLNRWAAPETCHLITSAATTTWLWGDGQEARSDRGRTAPWPAATEEMFFDSLEEIVVLNFIRPHFTETQRVRTEELDIAGIPWNFEDVSHCRKMLQWLQPELLKKALKGCYGRED